MGLIMRPAQISESFGLVKQYILNGGTTYSFLLHIKNHNEYH